MSVLATVSCIFLLLGVAWVLQAYFNNQTFRAEDRWAEAARMNAYSQLMKDQYRHDHEVLEKALEIERKKTARLEQEAERAKIRREIEKEMGVSSVKSDTSNLLDLLD